MMKLDAVLPYVFGLALVAGAYAAQMYHPQTIASGPGKPAATAQTSQVPPSWVPGWLVQPLSRALADATDPRERSR